MENLPWPQYYIYRGSASDRRGVSAGAGGVSGLRSSRQGHALVIRARSSMGPRTRGGPEPAMNIARSGSEVLREHVEREVEAIDRMYLNVYVPHLQSVGAVVGYLRVHRGQRFASTTAVTPMTEAFVRNIDQFVNHEGVDLVAFQKGQRKDDVTQKYLRRFREREGVLYVGKAQEKARVMRTERRRSRYTGGTYPWIVESTAMVNHYYFYCVDEDFGPFFVKFCSYFPYNAKLPATSVSAPRPRRRLSLRPLHPAGRVLAHPGARPAGDGARFLRRGDPREPRYRPPQPGEPGVRPQGEPPHAGAVPHPCHHPRRGAFAARRLQEDPHQAIPQGGTGASHRNHHQRHPRLRHRPTHRKSPGTAQDRLCGQPTSARRPTHRSRLLHRRSLLPGHAKTCHGEPPTRGGAAFRRSARSVSLARPDAVPSRPGHIYPQGCTRASCSTAGDKAQPTDPGTDHLRPASLASPRPHRAHSENSPLPHHAQGIAHRHLLYRPL